MIDLSVIIVSFNTQKLLEDCLNSIFQQTRDISYEVIVVDNGSTDDSVKTVKELFINELKKKKQLVNPLTRNKLIINKENLGFAKANNQGIKIAKGRYILLLNSDTTVVNSALKDLVDFARLKKNAAIVGPLLLNLDGTPQLSTAHFLTLPIAAAWLFTGDRLVYTSPDREAQVDWVMGSAMLVKKEAIEKVGMLDENFFMYVEEQEWCYRIKKAGFEIWFYPGAKIFHLVRGSSPASWRGKKRAILGIYKGLIYFYQKHFAPWQLIMLKFLLRAKAVSAWTIGFLVNNRELRETYEKAFKLV